MYTTPDETAINTAT